jgi:hypothetical protein
VKDFQSGGKLRVLRALSKFETSLGAMLEKYGERKHAENASADFAAGKEAQHTAYNYLKVYDGLQAEVDSGRFQAELKGMADDPNTDLTNFDALSEEILKKYVDGKRSTYITQFAPRAARSVRLLGGYFDEKMREEFKGEALDQIGEIARNEAHNWVNNQDDEGNEIDPSYRAQSLRDKLAELQEKGKAMKLDRKEVTARFLKELGIAAIKAGRPDLLDFGELNDESGRSPANSGFSDELLSLRNRAKQSREDMDRDHAAAQKEAFEQAKNKTMNESFIGIAELDPTNLDGIQDMRQRIYDLQEVLKPTEFKGLLDAVDKLQDKAGFAERSDLSVWGKLLVKANDGTLTIDELVEARESLTEKDFRSLFKRFAAKRINLFRLPKQKPLLKA